MAKALLVNAKLDTLDLDIRDAIDLLDDVFFLLNPDVVEGD